MKKSFNAILAFLIFGCMGLYSQTIPTAWNLDTQGDYSLTEWAATNAAGTYPASMRFHFMAVKDPSITVEGTSDYTEAYNLTAMAKVYGLGENGIAFQNNSSGKQGMALLALNTKNRNTIEISWTGRTIALNVGRVFAITLQYKLPNDAGWTTLNSYVEQNNASSVAGSSQAIPAVTLPESLEDQDVVYLRWVYNYVSGGGGRPKIGFDDVLITSQSNAGLPKAIALKEMSSEFVSVGVPFNFTIKPVGDEGTTKSLTKNTQFILSKTDGNGKIIPLANLTKNAVIGDNEVAFTDIILTTTGKKTLRVVAMNGNALTPLELNINVVPAPSIFSFENLLTKGHVGTPLPVFYVIARNSDNSITTTYNGPVTLDVVSGDDNISRPNTVYAVNGVATFNNIEFSAAGNYQIEPHATGVFYYEKANIAINPAVTFTEVMVPEYMTGYNSSADKPAWDKSNKSHNWKIPAYSLIRIENLHPGVEYRYTTRVMTTTDNDITNAKGHNLYFDVVTDSAYYSSRYTDAGKDSMSVPQPYSSFIATSGTKNLWINIVPNTLNIFYNNVRLNWVLNLATEKGNVFARYRTENSTQPIYFGEYNANSTGIADRNSRLPEGHYVALYCGFGENQKLATIAQVQDDGAVLIDENNSTGVRFSPSGPIFYVASDTKAHSWATIIPNSYIINSEAVSAGISKMEEYDADGNLVNTWEDADGIWGGINTNFANGAKYNPIYFETPHIAANITIDNVVCDEHPLNLTCATYGVEKVDILYSTDGGIHYETLVSGIATKRVDDENSLLDYDLDFTDFDAYGEPIMLKVVSFDQPATFALSNIFTVYNSPKFTNVTGGGLFCKGDMVTLMAKAGGNIQGYQWTKDGKPLAGENRISLQIESATYENSGVYNCIAYGEGLCSEAVSENVLVYVEEDTRVITNPKDVYNVAGRNAQFEVKVHSIGLPADYMASFQWFKGETPLADDRKYSGTNSSLLTVTNINADDENADYWVRVTGLCASDDSEPARIHIVNIGIESLTADQTICEGTALDLAVIANATGEVTYQWFKNSMPIANANATNYTVEAASVENAGMYSVSITDAATGFAIVSREIAVTVNVAPSITLQPQAILNVVAGDIVTLSVAVNQAGVSYQWYRNNTAIEGANAATYEFPVISENQAGKYYCEISNECGVATSTVSTVTLIPEGKSSVRETSASGFVLSAPVPNPMTSASTINYYIPQSSDIRISLCDASGRTISELLNASQELGEHTLQINQNELNLTSGMYYIMLNANGVSLMTKLSVIK